MKSYFKAGAHVHILSNPTPFKEIGIPFRDWKILYHKIPFYTISQINELSGWITLEESQFIFNETCFREYYNNESTYEEASIAPQASYLTEEDIAREILAAIERYTQKPAPPKKEPPELKHITPPPIRTGKTGIYSLRPVHSRKEFQEINEKRGWIYHE